MTDDDTIETVLLQAAGAHRPSSPDISPILALIEEGYDLDRDILPGVREGARTAKSPITSWRYFLPAIKKARTAEAISVEPRPVTWILSSDPRFGDLAEQWRREKGKRPAPYASKWFTGYGWAFPAQWVQS